MRLYLALRKLRELSSSPQDPVLAFPQQESAELFRNSTDLADTHRVSVLWRIEYSEDPSEVACVEAAAFSVIPRERFV